MNIGQIRRHLPALCLALGAGLFVRLAWLSWIHPNPNDGRFDDTVWYRNSAHYISTGEGYLNPFSGTPTAGWPPGYPAYLGLVFRFFGESDMRAYLANAAAALATIAIVYCIGLLLFDRRTALVGALAIAIWPGQVFFTSLALSEVLFTTLFSGALLHRAARPEGTHWTRPARYPLRPCDRRRDADPRSGAGLAAPRRRRLAPRRIRMATGDRLGYACRCRAGGGSRAVGLPQSARAR